jgi:hypothetical protein
MPPTEKGRTTRVCVKQYGTHVHLIRQSVRRPWSRAARPLDAIIVPAAREAHSLDYAITLAKAVGCRLVVLASRQCVPDAVWRRFEIHSFERGIVIAIPRGYQLPMRFETSPVVNDDVRKASAGRTSDLSIKRNLGLLLAHLLDWGRILFLDDDIQQVSVRRLRCTLAMLDHYRSVGTLVPDFPDNSVACHAHRATGGSQDVFVTGSVLAVNCEKPVEFFPDIYNEDWLYLYPQVADRTLAWSRGWAKQRRYDPFQNPARAAREEFGDVLAEGLYATLHNGRRGELYDPRYWAEFTDARSDFLIAIRKRAEQRGTQVAGLAEAVQAAHDQLIRIEADWYGAYLGLWQQDRRTWAQYVGRLRKAPSLDAALDGLGLAGAGTGAGSGAGRAELLSRAARVPSAP